MPCLRLLLIALFSFVFLQAAHARETITLVADEWCPYNCGENDVKQGYMVDLAREALAKSDIDVVYKVMPWEEAVAAVRAGKYAGIIGANPGDAPDFIYPDMVQGISLNLAWVKSDSDWEYKNPASLKGKRVGIVAGYSYGKALDGFFKNTPQQLLVKSTSNATEHNIDELLAGRIDVIFEDENVVKYYFASRGLPVALKMVGNPVDASNVDDTYIFVAFSPANKASTHYTELLMQGIHEMEKNGELEAILDRYHMDRNYRFPATHAHSH